MGVGVSLKNLMTFIIKNIEMNAHRSKTDFCCCEGGQMNLNFTGQVRIVLQCSQLSTIYGHKVAPMGPEWEAQMRFRQCIVLYGGTAHSLPCAHPWVFNMAKTQRSSWMFDHPAAPNTFHLWKSHWLMSFLKYLLLCFPDTRQDGMTHFP